MLLFTMDPILIAVAVIPAAILLVQIYRADKVEKEPIGLLLSLAFFGVIATALAILTEQLGTYLLAPVEKSNPVLYHALMYFIVVAVSEEGFKYLVLKVRTWRSPAFNCQFDAVVYSVFVALGFALWENIGYTAIYGFGTALLRAVTAIPGHASFGVFMGAWYGFAKQYENAGFPGKSKACRAMAFLFPVFLHGCYDFAAVMGAQHYTWIFFVFIVVMFVLAFRLVRRLSASDRFIGARSL